MIDKAYELDEAVKDVPDGATILVGGFGEVGSPIELLGALERQGARELTIVSNNAGAGQVGIAALLRAGRIRKIVCSFPKAAGSTVFEDLYRQGRIELELVPQGTLAERIRAAGAGIGAFFTPTGAGTALAQGKETRVLEGVEQLLELPIRGDFAFVKAHSADRWGNLTYRLAARNFGPVMCTAARITVVQVDRWAEVGSLDPERVVTPCLYVHRIVKIAAPAAADAATAGETAVLS